MTALPGRVVRAAASALLLLASAACSHSIDRQTSFSASEPDALVVVALKLDFLNRRPTQLPAMHMQWSAYDPERDEIHRLPNILLFYPECRSSTECPPGAYDVLRVKPGHYLLTSITVTWKTPRSSQTHVHSLVGLKKNWANYDEVDMDAKPSQTRTHRFKVDAGEIVYLGTFVLEGSELQPKLKAIESDLASARRWLSQYPNVDGEPVFRTPLALAPSS